MLLCWYLIEPPTLQLHPQKQQEFVSSFLSFRRPLQFFQELKGLCFPSDSKATERTVTKRLPVSSPSKWGYETITRHTSFLIISEGNVCLEITQSARVRVFLSEVFTAMLFNVESKSSTSDAESRMQHSLLMYLTS